MAQDLGFSSVKAMRDHFKAQKDAAAEADAKKAEGNADLAKVLEEKRALEDAIALRDRELANVVDAELSKAPEAMVKALKEDHPDFDGYTPAEQLEKYRSARRYWDAAQPAAEPAPETKPATKPATPGHTRASEPPADVMQKGRALMDKIRDPGTPWREKQSAQNEFKKLRANYPRTTFGK